MGAAGLVGLPFQVAHSTMKHVHASTAEVGYALSSIMMNNLTEKGSSEHEITQRGLGMNMGLVTDPFLGSMKSEKKQGADVGWMPQF